MSKSDPSDYSRINLSDGPDEIALKIRRAKTDPEPLPESTEGFEGRPEAANLINIYAALAESDVDSVLTEYGGGQFSQFKERLTELAVDRFGPIGAEMQRLTAHPDYVDRVLKDGAERARALSLPVITEVQDIVGFLRV